MFVITVINDARKFWLKGTTWTFSQERANKFETETLAREAAKRAEKFMHRSIKKSYKVERYDPT